MATLRLFAAARQAAGTGRADFEAPTVAAVLAAACERFGGDFETVLASCQVWLNGEPTVGSAPVAAHDEVAVLPPVSGG
ncbi:MAG: hypothetical protein JWL70_1128 [Acidimicrobiia bacterium]|nr:hypothetical protein [Acidimicrobiia bacterium]